MATVARDSAPAKNRAEEVVKARISTAWERWSARHLPLWERRPGAVSVATIWGLLLLIAVLSPAIMDRRYPREELLAGRSDGIWLFDNNVLKIVLEISVILNIAATFFCLCRGFSRRHLALLALILVHGVLYCAARSMEIGYRYRAEWTANDGKTRGQVSPIALAAEVVNDDVQSWGNDCGLAPEYLYALSAMDYVQNTLSTGRFRVLSLKRQLPQRLDAETCLFLRAGCCGNHVETFDKVLGRCQFPVKRRGVEFYLHNEASAANSSHVAAEVYYKGGWHFFDVICGTFFVRRGAKTQDDLLSLEEIRGLIARGEPWRDLAVVNSGAVWRRQAVLSGNDPYWALTWPETDVLLGHAGTIRLFADATDKTRYSLDQMTTTVGHVEGYCGNVGEVRFQLDGAVLRAGQQGILSIRIKQLDPRNANLVVRSSSQILSSVPLSDIKLDEEIHIDVRHVTDDLSVQIDSAEEDGCAILSEIFVR
jgi:hypothetical protein